MGLDRRRRPAHRDALDHVGIERALHQEIRAAELRGFRVEHLDEQAADDLALLLRVRDARELGQEALAGVHRNQPQVQVRAERALDFGALAFAQQAVIDEDAGEPIADRALHERRRDRGINAAREAANRAPRADLFAHALHRAVHERRNRPAPCAAAQAEREVAQQLVAALGVQHLGMKLHAQQRARSVGDRRERRVRAGRDHLEAVGQPQHAIAVAHPDRVIRIAPARE